MRGREKGENQIQRERQTSTEKQTRTDTGVNKSPECFLGLRPEQLTLMSPGRWLGLADMVRAYIRPFPECG